MDPGPPRKRSSSTRRTREALHQSEERFRLLVAHALDAVITIDAEGLVTSWNPRAEALFGWPQEDVLGRRLSATIIPPAYREAHERGLAHFRATGEGPALNRRIELTALHKNGTEFPVELTITPMQIGRGTVFSAFVRDISERKRTEQALRDSEASFRLMFADNPLPMWVYDLETLAFLEVNGAAVARYGYSRDEFLQMRITDIRPPEDVSRLLDITEGGIPKGQRDTGEWRHRLKDGRILDVLIASHSMEFAGRSARLVVAEDITERKRMEAEKLRQSDERFRLLVAGVTDYAILMLDPEGRVASWNAGAERIKGYRAEEIVGQHFSCFYSDDDVRRGKPAAKLVQARQVGRVEDEGWRIRKDGSRFWASVVITAMQDDAGRLRGFSKVTRDMTERKQTEEALREARQQAERANQAKSEFLSRMSHELRTPLNSIIGFAQLLEFEVKRPEDRESVEQIMKGGKHLLDLINEILDIARIEAGRLPLSPEPVRVGEAVQRVLDLTRPLATARGIEVRTTGTVVYSRHVWADNQRLQQVLLNLVSNAIKYNRDGGTLTVACEGGQDGRLRISVTDTGPGISAALRERLFQPFERLGAQEHGVEGTGLGLALSKGLVEAMGGVIGVESVPGEGSTFWVELLEAEHPLERQERTERDTMVLPTSPEKRGIVLYVEDNLSNLRLVERMLARRPGVTLIPAMQGRLGLALARQHRPDLVLLDLHLPDISGDQVLRELRGVPELRQTPVIVLSADATPGQVQRLLEAGARAYLTKPLDVRQLLGLLDEALPAQEPRGVP